VRGGCLVHCPGAARVDDAVLHAVAGADAVLFDGTFWSDDELVRAGLGTRTAADMAHVPIAGPSGSLARLAGVTAPRRIFIHMNNTNPVLRDDGPERRQVTDAGWEVAHDGLELAL
jgi:pyrroloquinoline quinone biosynthesis protein B